MNLKTLTKMVSISGLVLLLAACSETGDFTQEQICRASIAAIKGKSPTVMVVDKTEVEAETELNIFHISYKRPDDGKKWHFRCKIDKKRAVWAQGKDGRWRDQAQDPTIRFSIEGDELNINETFPDGSAAANVSFNISLLGDNS
ncbi:hypothetical protein [Enterovibrio paralichthyis]|uniref:hypothetical protein n=1 Tax=Enterovibrio paralichthyis TaxID=2853805 RepID=UPI001C4607CE|nr:hypothetical protein [Enterovibrio paralichthyis]MBV7297468.1 hypothetical protein [Enterovibrio paralichthyis]